MPVGSGFHWKRGEWASETYDSEKCCASLVFVILSGKYVPKKKAFEQVHTHTNTHTIDAAVQWHHLTKWIKR